MAENATSNPPERNLLQAICSVLISALFFVAGLIVLFLTFWVTYGVIWVCIFSASAASELLFDKRLALAHMWRLTLSAIFIVLLFIGNARTSREYLTDYSRPGCLHVCRSRILSMPYPGILSKIIADLLFTGPRLVVYAFRLATHPKTKFPF